MTLGLLTSHSNTPLFRLPPSPILRRRRRHQQIVQLHHPARPRLRPQSPNSRLPHNFNHNHLRTRPQTLEQEHHILHIAREKSRVRRPREPLGTLIQPLALRIRVHDERESPLPVKDDGSTAVGPRPRMSRMSRMSCAVAVR